MPNSISFVTALLKEEKRTDFDVFLPLFVFWVYDYCNAGKRLVVFIHCFRISQEICFCFVEYNSDIKI